MKYLILILVFSFALTGCDSSMKQAKARSRNAATDRANDLHREKLADSRALAPVRLIVKEVGLWSLMVGVVVVVISVAGSLAYFSIGASVYAVRDRKTQQISLDVTTRQYPLLMYGNGRRIFNPNNGERLLLSDTSEAHLPRIEATAKVQLAGLITDNSKIINSEVAK